MADTISIVTELQEICKKNKVPLGEGLLLINKGFGYVWDNIPIHQEEPVKTWLINNIKNKDRILYPEFMMKYDKFCQANNFHVKSRDQVIEETMTLVKQAFERMKGKK